MDPDKAIQKQLVSSGFTVTASEHEGRVDRFLSSLLYGWSRSMVNDLVKRGGVYINDTVVNKGSKAIRMRDTVHVDAKIFETVARELRASAAVRDFAFTGERSAVVPEDIPLDILYEDDDVLIVDKPAGMVVHPAYANRTGTLANAIAGYFEHKQIDRPHRVGLVHRLDKDVSGLMVIAKHDRALSILAEQFSGKEISPDTRLSLKRKAHKFYWAIITEKHPDALDRAGLLGGQEVPIQGYIRRNQRNRKICEFIPYPREFNGGPSGKFALSYVKRKEAAKVKSNTHLLEIQIVTGRTHQIRAQLASLGLPIVGDIAYGGDSEADLSGIRLRCVSISYIPVRVYELTDKMAHFKEKIEMPVSLIKETAVPISGISGTGLHKTVYSEEDGCVRSTLEYFVLP